MRADKSASPFLLPVIPVCISLLPFEELSAAFKGFKSPHDIPVKEVKYHLF